MHFLISTPRMEETCSTSTFSSDLCNTFCHQRTQYGATEKIKKKLEGGAEKAKWVQIDHFGARSLLSKTIFCHFPQGDFFFQPRTSSSFLLL